MNAPRTKRKLVGYEDCRCVLAQYCDGKCRPIFADVPIPDAPSFRSADNVSPQSNEQDAFLASPALSAQPQGEREAFEAWAREFGFCLSRKANDDVYDLPITDWSWLAWQARASLSASTPSAVSAEPDLSGLPAVIAGALFDFAGYLTTREEVIEVGSTAMSGPVADLLKAWASDRGLRLEEAAVLSWQELISPAAMGTPPADKENGNAG